MKLRARQQSAQRKGVGKNRKEVGVEEQPCARVTRALGDLALLLVKRGRTTGEKREAAEWAERLELRTKELEAKAA